MKKINKFKIEEYNYLKHGNKRFVLNERLTEKLKQEKEVFLRTLRFKKVISEFGIDVNSLIFDIQYIENI